MGIFDSLLGLQSADNTSRAATNVQNNVSNWTNGLDTDLRGFNVAGQNAVNSGTTDAVNAIDNISMPALGQASGYLSGALPRELGYLGQASGNYTPYLTSGASATGMLDNALGLNGADGNAAATKAFQAGPGYQWNVGQATDAATRAAAATGMGASGNTLTAVSKLGQNLANQEYGNWLTNLTGQQGAGLTAAAGQGGILSGAAGAVGNNALGQASIAGQQSGLGTNIAGLYANQGALDAGLSTTIGNQESTLAPQLLNLASNAAMGAGNAEDKAQNANNAITGGLFSGLLGSLFG